MTEVKYLEVGPGPDYWWPSENPPYPLDGTPELTVGHLLRPLVGPALGLGLILHHGNAPEIVRACEKAYAPQPAPCEHLAEFGKGLGGSTSSTASMVPSTPQLAYASTAPRALDRISGPRFSS